MTGIRQTTTGENGEPPIHRIAFLQKAPSGHVDACLRALTDTGHVELLATIPATLSDAPFADDQRDWIHHRVPITDLKRSRELADVVKDFDPALVIIVGWEPPAYRKIARELRHTARRIVCMDHQYRGTVKQRLGILGSRVYLRPFFDGAFVAGERQRRFAQRLGFEESTIYSGLYSCDSARFARVPALSARTHERRRRFLSVARLVPVKGVDVLVEAYRRYRSSVDDPWDLVIAGTGELSSLLEGQEGIDLRGFVQPSDLESVFAEASCLVLPSTFEPWGVVVHEAAAAGLALVCSEAVGAADHFVRDKANGVVVPVGDVEALTSALTWVHDRSPTEIEAASDTSRELGSTITPQAWASTVLSMLEPED